MASKTIRTMAGFFGPESDEIIHVHAMRSLESALGHMEDAHRHYMEAWEHLEDARNLIMAADYLVKGEDDEKAEF